MNSAAEKEAEERRSKQANDQERLELTRVSWKRILLSKLYSITEFGDLKQVFSME